jgi:putative addiction module component (TIGR02574 family)
MSHMTRAGRDLLALAMELPSAERAKLAQKLLDSLDHEQTGDIEIDPELKAEIDRRVADQPAPGERWPTADEAVELVRRSIRKASSRRSKKRGA